MSNQRLKQIAKKRNIKSLTFHIQRELIIFPNKEDPHILKQITEELSVPDDVVNVAYFPPGGRRNLQNRVTLKQSGDFYACIFYIQSVSLFFQVQLSFVCFYFFANWTSKELILIKLLKNEKLMMQTTQALTI